MSMMLNTVVCGSNPQQNSIILSYIKKLEIELDVDFNVKLFTSGNSLLEKYYCYDSFNIIFLDIELPDINGIEVASQIRQSGDKHVKIVFISNNSKHMKDSFIVHPFNYILKPVDYETLRSTLLKIIDDYKSSYITKLIIHTNGSDKLVNINDIIYIQALKSEKYKLLFTLKDEIIYGKGSINEWEQDIAGFGFISPYRGILVNINYIRSFDSTSLILTNGATIPVSRRKEKELRAMFSGNIINTLIHK